MKRALALLLGAIVVIVLGCGAPSYEKRFGDTEKAIKDQIEVDHYLNPAPADKFKDMGFFLRPPKALPGTPARLALAELPPGAYDVEGSFVSGKEGGAANLHFLGRRKLAKKATTKKGDAPPAPAVERGPFTQDVQTLLGSVYPAAAQAGIGKDPVLEGKNSFKRQRFAANEATKVDVYYYTEKFGEDTYDAALIWELPAKLTEATSRGVNLSLKSFAVGPKAARAFSGEAVDVGAGEEGTATPF